MKKIFRRDKRQQEAPAVETVPAVVTLEYETLFFKKAEIKARSGKVVYIRKEHHDRLMKIVRVIGENEFTLFNYLDNILGNHFSTYEDKITELYHKSKTCEISYTVISTL